MCKRPCASVSAVALLLLTVVGCASTAHLSFVHGDLQTRVHRDLYPVTILAVDGELSFDSPRAVAPGPRWLLLQAAPAQGAGVVPQKAIVLRVEPCTRYYLAAKRQSPMASDWEVVVERKEPVSGCNPESELKKPGAKALAQPL